MTKFDQKATFPLLVEVLKSEILEKEFLARLD